MFFDFFLKFSFFQNFPKLMDIMGLVAGKIVEQRRPHRPHLSIHTWAWCLYSPRELRVQSRLTVRQISAPADCLALVLLFEGRTSGSTLHVSNFHFGWLWAPVHNVNGISIWLQIFGRGSLSEIFTKTIEIYEFSDFLNPEKPRDQISLWFPPAETRFTVNRRLGA